MDIITHPTVLAAIIATAFGATSALIADRVRKAAVRNDIATRTIESQFQGWDKYTGHLMQRISALEAELRRQDEDCEHRIAAIEAEMRRRDEACQARIQALETRLTTR